jgi:hypothetical protein
LGLSFPCGEDGIERSEQHAHTLPKGLDCSLRRFVSYLLRQGGFHIHADVIGMPESRIEARRPPPASQHGCRCKIRRVGLEHVGLLRSNAAPDLVDTVQEVIGGVVR